MDIDFDNAARLVSVYKDGVLVSSRPYTEEENRLADQWDAAQVASAKRETERTLIKAIITDLRAEKDRAQAVIDDPAATKNEKNLGRAAKRIADAAIDLARFVQDS